MDKTYLGRRLEEFSPGIASKPITKVELLDENGNVVGVSGSDTGRTLTALQPDGTNAMAAAILAKVSGYKHIGYDGSKALLDPAVELGDAVTVGGLYVPLIALDMTFDPMLAPNISAPDADEIDDEFPYKSPTQRQIERNMAKTRSLITKTSEEIMLKVNDIDGEYTELKTTVDGVTITDQSGTTKIKGSSIETASIAANAIRADQVNLTGAISWADLDSNVRAEINDRGDDNPSYIKWSYIDSAKIVSPHIYGGDLYATGQGNAAGTNPAFYMSDGVTGSGANTEPNAPKGWLCFDKNGAGTAQEAAERVFLHSQPNVAIKIESGGNMSLDAAGHIHMQAPITLQSGVNYGTSAQRDAITPENGRIFFVVE